ncbi:MAG TPA: hypothetical protein DCQ29_12695 [Chitinophagaceae bacterium]|nr:hypothetical protein [Chitinophagaceae bacterium]
MDIKDLKIDYYNSHPIQYFSPMLRLLSKKSDLHVYYFSGGENKVFFDKGFNQKIQWDVPLTEGYQHTFLKNYVNRSVRDNNFWDVFNPGVFKVIRKSPSKVVLVNGWSYSSFWMVMIAAKLFGKKVWLRAENPLNQELNKSRKVKLVKNFLFKNLLFKFFVNKCLYIGNQSHDFFTHYGVSDDRLVFTPYAVDNIFFNAEYEKYKDEKESLRQALNIPLQSTTILFCGKYIEKKRPLDLLKAFHALGNKSAFLVMLGEGELRPQMESYIKENNLHNILLTGFVNQTEISKYYSAADIFVMCSGMGETWGLSVNEAMNFALPVVVSETCGSSYDLVEQGVNGYSFPEGDIEQLTFCIQQLLQDHQLRISAGKKSKEIISNYSIEKTVDNIIAALEQEGS